MDFKNFSPALSKLALGLLWAEMVVCGLLHGQPMAGPVDVVLKRLEMCPKRFRGEDGLRFHNVSGFASKQRPFEYFLTADFVTEFPLDDSLAVDLALAQWNQGGWKNGMKVMQIQRMCSSLQQYGGQMFRSIFIQVFRQEPNCPIPATRESLRNVSVNTKLVGLREFMYGKWRVDLSIKKNSKTKACFRVFSDLSPRTTNDR